MTEIIRYTLLRCTEGNSDKFYEIKLLTPGECIGGYTTRHTVAIRYGRCTGNWQTEGGREGYQRHKYRFTADSDFHKKESNKIYKGYYVVSQQLPASELQPTVQAKGINPPSAEKEKDPPKKEETMQQKLAKFMIRNRF